VHGALEGLRRSGRADRIDRTVWAIQGTPQLPARLLLIVSGATPREFEMRLEAAAELLARLDDPADLVLCDPPYGLTVAAATTPMATVPQTVSACLI
jgi:hypothetical protein